MEIHPTNYHLHFRMSILKLPVINRTYYYSKDYLLHFCKYITLFPDMYPTWILNFSQFEKFLSDS